jgi:nitrate reductase gamma subunit
VVLDLEPREKTRRWISTLVSLSIILIPVLFFLGLSSPGQSSSQTTLNTGYQTDAQVIFNAFLGFAVILFFLFVPIFYILYKKDKKVDLR